MFFSLLHFSSPFVGNGEYKSGSKDQQADAGHGPGIRRQAVLGLRLSLGLIAGIRSLGPVSGHGLSGGVPPSGPWGNTYLSAWACSIF